MLEFKHTYNLHQCQAHIQSSSMEETKQATRERDEKIVYACIDKYLSSSLYILGSKEGKLTALTNF